MIKQAIRGVLRAKRTFFSCILLIALGIGSLVGFSSAGARLQDALNQLYSNQSFADVFAYGAAFTQDTRSLVARQDGVEEATARLSIHTQLVNQNNELEKELFLISFDSAQSDELNKVRLVSGNMPASGELLIGKPFFDTNKLSIGQSLRLHTPSGDRTYTISGVAASPEYITGMGNGVTGNSKTSGFAYASLADVAPLATTAGYNEILIRLEQGVTYAQLEHNLRDLLSPYGLTTLHDRDGHTDASNAGMSIRNLQNTAGMISFVFLAVAVLVIYIAMRRVIDQERTQIGTMKAFGVSNQRILGLYISYGIFVSIFGWMLGLALSIPLHLWIYTMYQSMFSIIDIPLHIQPSLIIGSLLAGALAGMAGAAFGAKRVMNLQPAEAMRPEAPPAVKAPRKTHKTSGKNQSSLLVFRSIYRNKGRSAFVVMGMMLAFGIMTFMSSYASLMDEVLMEQFSYVQVYDVKATLQQPQSIQQALTAANALKHAEYAEGMLELSSTAYQAQRKTDASVMGVLPEQSLYRLFDSQTKQYKALPESGALINNILAEKLDVSIGQSLWLTLPQTGDTRHEIKVSGILNENMGANIYMNAYQLCDLINTTPAINTLLFRTDNTNALVDELAHAKNITNVQDQAELQMATQQMLNQNLGASIGAFAAIGFGIAFALVLSSSSIALSERAREYATMQVLGMSAQQVAALFRREYFLLTLISFLPGIPFSIGFRAIVTRAIDYNTLSISPLPDPLHYVMGGIICLLVVALAMQASRRQIMRLSLTEVLKERE